MGSESQIEDHNKNKSNEQTGDSSSKLLDSANSSSINDLSTRQSSPDTASQHLPQGFAVVDGSVNHGGQPNAQDKCGNTSLKRDDGGNVKEYDSGDYSLAKHDDGKWYYHQNGDGHKFVEVDGNTIKMDDSGKITYNESGLFGKDNQTLGLGSSGFFSAFTSAASHIAAHPLDTLNTVAFAPLAAVDAITGTHSIKAIGDLEKGAANEIIHHPLDILEDAALGAGIGLATVLAVPTGGGSLVALGVGLGIGSAVFGGAELLVNEGNLSGVAKDVKNIGSTIADWGHDFATVSASGQSSAQDQQAAEQGLQQAGAFGAQTLAGLAGGVAGGYGASAAGLGPIPDVIPAGTKGAHVPTEPVKVPPVLPNPTFSVGDPNIRDDRAHSGSNDDGAELPHPTMDPPN